MAGNAAAGVSRLVAGTAAVAGALFIVIPRFAFPPCASEGHTVTRCADTAAAEMVLGGLLLAAGLVAPVARRSWVLLAELAALCVALAAAWFLPDVFGYCPSPRMRCHYGMVPAIRFTAGLAAAVLISAAAFRANAADLRGEPS